MSELEAIISNLSRSALSQHLSRLRRANIMRTRRESQTIYFSIEDTDFLHILRLLSHIYNHDQVTRLRRHSTRLYLTRWHPAKKRHSGMTSHPCRSINWVNANQTPINACVRPNTVRSTQRNRQTNGLFFFPNPATFAADAADVYLSSHC